MAKASVSSAYVREKLDVIPERSESRTINDLGGDGIGLARDDLEIPDSRDELPERGLLLAGEGLQVNPQNRENPKDRHHDEDDVDDGG